MGILARVTLGQECFVVLMLNIYTDHGGGGKLAC